MRQALLFLSIVLKLFFQYIVYLSSKHETFDMKFLTFDIGFLTYSSRIQYILPKNTNLAKDIMNTFKK